MPKIEELTKKTENKFQKSSYRPWNFIEQLEAEQIQKDNIEEILTENIIRWKYKDRPENELGDIADLAETFKTVGQQQPCIARKSVEETGKYELIVGERRWKAAEKAGIPLKVIVRDIDDKTAALIQAIENEKRKDISEFSRGMSYADKIEKGIIAQKDLIEILGISKQQISRLLSYSKIPQALFDAINDFRRVSSRTAVELVRLSRKSDEHLKILIELAEKIRTGEYGQKLIEREIDKKLYGTSESLENIVVKTNNGKTLFTCKNEEHEFSINFSKEITNTLKTNNENLKELCEELKNIIVGKFLKP